MNKKLLLVSLLSVGMLVGCGGGDTSSSSEKPAGGSTTPSAGESVTPSTGTTSEEASQEAGGSTEQGGGEQSGWTGQFGNEGYYIVGDLNGWNNFWKYEGFEKFQYQPTEEAGIYTLTYSVSEDLLKDDKGNAKPFNFKAMKWDGTHAPSTWLPDGVDNNGQITEPGEYKFTFSEKAIYDAVDQTDDHKAFKTNTKAEKIGEFNPETAYPQGDPRQFEPTYHAVKYRVVLDGDLRIPEGKHVFLHIWDNLNEQNETIDARQPQLTKVSDTVYEWTTPESIQVDAGTDVGLDLQFCIVVADEGWDATKSWDGQIKNHASGDGNWSIHVGKNKHNGTVQVTRADRPYWTKGQEDNPYSVEEAMGKMDAEGFVAATKLAVEGKVTELALDQDSGVYDITLETPKKEEPKGQAEVAPETPAPETPVEKPVLVKVAAKLRAGTDLPEVGDTIRVIGEATKNESTYTFGGKTAEIYNTVKAAEKLAYVRGDMNGWLNGPDGKFAANPAYQLQFNGTAGQYEIVLDLVANQNFKIAINDWAENFGGAKVTLGEGAEEFIDKSGDNIKCIKDGKIKVLLDTTGESKTVTLSVVA